MLPKHFENRVQKREQESPFLCKETCIISLNCIKKYFSAGFIIFKGVGKGSMCFFQFGIKIMCYFNGWSVMLYSTRQLVRGGAICPLKKTLKDLCDRRKIAVGLEVVNSSTKMQFYVN